MSWKPTLSFSLLKTLLLFVLLWHLLVTTEACVSIICRPSRSTASSLCYQTLCGFELKEDSSKRWDGWTWKRSRTEGSADGEDCGLIKRDGGLKMEEFLGTRIFVRIRSGQEDDGCEDETASVSEGWGLLASSSVCLCPHCQARWKIQSSSASNTLRRAFTQIQRLSQPIDLSPCWKY